MNNNRGFGENVMNMNIFTSEGFAGQSHITAFIVSLNIARCIPFRWIIYDWPFRWN